MPHLLIAGATGRGKTSQIHSIVSWLIQHTTPDQVQMILIDLKEGLDLTRYNGIPHLTRPVCITAEQAYQSLKWVDAEITRRGELFREVLAENIFTYRKRTGQFLNNVVFVFDEITNLGKLPPEEKAEAWFLLRDGSQRARALGIHFIISTQRPSVEVIDGDIKMNFTARIGFGTATGTDSRVILDNNMAEGLDVGDLVYQDGGTRGVFLRGPYIKTDQADQMVREVIRQHNHNTRQAQREAELEAQKRQHLTQRMLKYATEENEGRFSVETLYERFGNEITLADLKDLAKELEEKGVLLPAAGQRPRQIVGCRLSDGGEESPASPESDNLTPKNGNGRIK
jgi:S-DNA-T family DNA segregation ATPase FtsK/SpoIIIE